MDWWKKSIFFRLLFSFIFTVLLGLGVVGLLMSFLTKSYIYESAEQELLRKGNRVNAAIQNLSHSDEIENVLSFLDESFNARIWVFNKDGEIIHTSIKDEVSIGKSVHHLIVEKVLQGERPVSELEFEGLTEPMLSVVVPWGKEDQIYGGIVLHSPILGFEKTISNIRETIILATLFGIFLSTIMVSLLAWSISRPLKKIDRVAMEIGMGNYHKRIDHDSQDEIGDLSVTINKMAEQLEEVEQKRQKLDQSKEDFLANISHELRTPLTALQGFLEALQDQLVVDETGRQKYYGVMYRETIHMNRLIEDLMDLVKLERNEINLSMQPVSINKLLNNTVFKFGQEAEQKGIEFSVRIHNENQMVYGDPDRLQQIFNNLVMNALKYTETGQVAIKTDEERDHILFKISDTGMGISEQDLDRIWERFFKVDRGRSKKNKGTGLGLAIVKQLVENHEGDISVESELGKGTTFHLSLPKV
jgi:signal transduction histidine kinase